MKFYLTIFAKFAALFSLNAQGRHLTQSQSGLAQVNSEFMGMFGAEIKPTPCSAPGHLSTPVISIILKQQKTEHSHAFHPDFPERQPGPKHHNSLASRLGKALQNMKKPKQKVHHQHNHHDHVYHNVLQDSSVITQSSAPQQALSQKQFEENFGHQTLGNFLANSSLSAIQSPKGGITSPI